jgi:hypothetical protein
MGKEQSMRKEQKKSGSNANHTALQPDGCASRATPILTHRRAIVTLSVISILLGLWLLFAVVGTADKEALTGVSRLSVGETWGYMAIALIAFAAGMLGLKSEGVFNGTR